MLSFLRMYQVYILMGCGIISALLAFFVAFIKFQSIRKKRALLMIEVSSAIISIADAFAYHYSGDPSVMGFYAVRISDFLVYLFININIVCLNSYITTLIMEKGRYKKLPIPLLIGFILPSIQISLLVISQFTGWFYYYTPDNIYKHGPLALICFLIPCVEVLLQFALVLVHRKLIDKKLVTAISIFSLLPIAAGVAQYFIDDVILIDLSIFLAATSLFWLMLISQNREMTSVAYTELQTGLPNSYGFLYEVDRIVHYQNITDYNAYYFDIVRMGQIDRRYGKFKGDEIIVTYAKNIRKELDRDEILGRLGGNFFVALVKKSHTERFLALLADTPVAFDFEGQRELLHMSAIAGVYEVTSRNVAPGQLIGYTAAAVNYAKNVAHKPYVFLDDELENKLNRIHQMEERVRRAMKHGEFEVFYQPKVRTDLLELCGCEALVRWYHKGQMISPEEFIPIIENNGYICELDFYMLEHVCQELKDWMIQGIEPVVISVNFSRKNLSNPKLAQQIHDIVAKYDIPERLIQIEITETTDGYPLESLRKVVLELQRYGFTVAIDDFGTGSSSIRLLKEIPFDVMKIDKAFVDYRDEKEKQLLSDIIMMAQNIGIDVLAEGVRKQEQIAVLKKMGCNVVQGYIFDEPLERHMFEVRLKHKAYHNY